MRMLRIRRMLGRRRRTYWTDCLSSSCMKALASSLCQGLCVPSCALSPGAAQVCLVVGDLVEDLCWRMEVPCSTLELSEVLCWNLTQEVLGLTLNLADLCLTLIPEVPCWILNQEVLCWEQ